MYLKGSQLNLNKKHRRRKSNVYRIFVLVIFIALIVVLNETVVEETGPLFIPTTTPTRQPESFISEAMQTLEEGKLAQSIPLLEQAIHSDPENPSTYILLARVQVFIGDYESAIQNTEDALLLSENNAMAYAVRGWAQGLAGSYLEGEASIQEAISIDPNNGMAYAFLGEILTYQLMQGQGGINTLDEAVDASRNAVALAPNTLETYRTRGLILEYTGNYDEAIYNYQQAILINENIADIHIALGRVYYAIGDYANATEEYNRANTLNPSDPLPDFYISRAYATTGDYTNAIQYANLAVKDAPTDPILQANLGMMYYRQKDYASAIPPLRLALRGGATEDGSPVEPIPLDYGNPAEYFYIYGLALARSGQCGEALQISQSLQQVVPNDEIAMYNAGEMIVICEEIAEGIPQLTPTPAEDGMDDEG
ncbi:MAG: tetratricopeptide repeat protein [Anaerolineae bacterium]|jgi:tetratricopeptide (TPR) repeat protein|nr:tetratricopeptide repeat protein [Anaerolineae bacterium]